MNKKLLLISLISVNAFAQVGVNTSSPTETFDLNGTARVRELPLNGTINSITTINSSDATNGTASSTKNQTFSAINTVVVDKNGVVGIVTGLPITVAPTTKSIQYVTKTALIDANTATNSIITVGNLQVRFDGTNPNGGEQTWSFRLINDIRTQSGTAATADNVVANNIKVGSGGIFGGQFRQLSAQINTWYTMNATSGMPNVTNRDFVQSNISLVNTKEVYRLTITVTPTISLTSPNVSSQGQVSLFMERLTDQ
ncbi:hypothetical protein [Chryseobacterium aquaticum]|uniref:hypothetical protein n=1 Tax=Chryseobacterium aquaticum TaxID=452084 RepID=UPI003F7050E5